MFVFWNNWEQDNLLLKFSDLWGKGCIGWEECFKLCHQLFNKHNVLKTLVIANSLPTICTTVLLTPLAQGRMLFQRLVALKLCWLPLVTIKSGRRFLLLLLLFLRRRVSCSSSWPAGMGNSKLKLKKLQTLLCSVSIFCLAYRSHSHHLYLK